MADVGMFDLGPCVIALTSASITFESHGSVTFRDNVQHRTLTKGSEGTTPYGGKYVGREVEAVVPITEADWADLADVLPGATATTTNLTVANCVGEDMDDYADEVVIQPIGYEDGATGEDSDYWLYLLNAAPVVNMELTYDTDGQQVVECRFVAFPDSSGNIWRMGPAS